MCKVSADGWFTHGDTHQRTDYHANTWTDNYAGSAGDSHHGTCGDVFVAGGVRFVGE